MYTINPFEGALSFRLEEPYSSLLIKDPPTALDQVPELPRLQGGGVLGLPLRALAQGGAGHAPLEDCRGLITGRPGRVCILDIYIYVYAYIHIYIYIYFFFFCLYVVSSIPCWTTRNFQCQRLLEPSNSFWDFAPVDGAVDRVCRGASRGDNKARGQGQAAFDGGSIGMRIHMRHMRDCMHPSLHICACTDAVRGG